MGTRNYLRENQDVESVAKRYNEKEVPEEIGLGDVQLLHGSYQPSPLLQRPRNAGYLQFVAQNHGTTCLVRPSYFLLEQSTVKESQSGYNVML